MDGGADLHEVSNRKTMKNRSVAIFHPFFSWNDWISGPQQLGPAGLIAQDVLFGDFGEAAVLPFFGAAACKELFSPVGPAATTEPFLGAGFIYPPLAQ